MKHCLLGAEAAPGIFRGQVRREGGPPVCGPTHRVPTPWPSAGFALGSPQGWGAFGGGREPLLPQGHPPQPLGRGRLPVATLKDGTDRGRCGPPWGGRQEHGSLPVQSGWRPVLGAQEQTMPPGDLSHGGLPSEGSGAGRGAVFGSGDPKASSVQNLERRLPPRRGPGWNIITQRETLQL